MSRPSTFRVIAAVLLMQTLGSLGYPISVYGLQTIDPFTFAFFRFTLCAAIVMAVQLFWGEKTPPIEKQDWWRIISLGFLNIILTQLLFLIAQSKTAAGHGAVLYSMVPLWLLIFSVMMLGEKLNFKQILGTIIAVVGVVIIVTGGALKIGKEYLIGDLIMICSVFGWVFYTIMGKPLARKYGAFRVTAYALSIGALLYFPYGLYHSLHVDYSQIANGAWLSVIYMAIIWSIIGYSIWYWVLKHMEASRLAVYYNVQPIIATTTAFLFLNEPIRLPFVVGSLIVLVGVLTAELSMMKKTA